jgi:hypothetical protein
MRILYYFCSRKQETETYKAVTPFMPLALFIIIFYCAWWGGTESTWYCGHYRPIVPAPDDRWWWLWSSRWNEDWQGKPKYSEITSPSATLSITNPTWPDPGSNPATNHLSYGTTYACSIARSNSAGNNFFCIFILHLLSSFSLYFSYL